jgi:hypothetical protein
VANDAGAGNQIVQATAVFAKDEETIDEMEKHAAGLIGPRGFACVKHGKWSRLPRWKPRPSIRVLDPEIPPSIRLGSFSGASFKRSSEQTANL